MYKLSFLYRQVEDIEASNAFFTDYHLPSAEKLPDLLGSEVCYIDGKPGGASRFFLNYSLFFPSKEVLYASLSAPAGIQMLKTLEEWVESGAISWFHGEALADRHTSQAAVASSP